MACGAAWLGFAWKGWNWRGAVLVLIALMIPFPYTRYIENNEKM
jgi:hypothetical protein